MPSSDLQGLSLLAADTHCHLYVLVRTFAALAELPKHQRQVEVVPHISRQDHLRKAHLACNRHLPQHQMWVLLPHLEPRVVSQDIVNTRLRCPVHSSSKLEL